MPFHIDHSAVRLIGGTIVVDEIVVAWLAAGRTMLRLQVRDDLRDAWLRQVGAVHIGAALVPVLLVPVVRTGPRIRIFDQPSRRRRGVSIAVTIESEIAGAQVDEAGARASHDPLVKVVTDRIVVGDKFENWYISLRHIVEAHRDSALMGTLIGKRNRRRLALTAHSNSSRDPREQIASTLVELLPHLKEPMNRIAGKRELICCVMA